MRTTTEVFQDHLTKRLEGDVEGDIKANFSEDVVLLTGTQMYTGHDGVRKSARELSSYIGSDSTFNYLHTSVAGRFAFLEWNSISAEKPIHDGADSFVVEDGKIVFQSIHYSSGGKDNVAVKS